MPESMQRTKKPPTVNKLLLPNGVLAGTLCPFLTLEDQCRLSVCGQAVHQQFVTHVWPNVRSLTIWNSPSAMHHASCANLTRVEFHDTPKNDRCLELLNPKTCSHIIVHFTLHHAAHVFSLRDVWANKLTTFHVHNPLRIAREEAQLEDIHWFSQTAVLNIDVRILGSQLRHLTAPALVRNVRILEVLVDACPNLETLRSLFNTFEQEHESKEGLTLAPRAIAALGQLAPRLQHIGLEWQAWAAAVLWIQNVDPKRIQVCEVFGSIQSSAPRLFQGLDLLLQRSPTNLLLLAVDVLCAANALEHNDRRMSAILDKFASSGTVVFVNRSWSITKQQTAANRMIYTTAAKWVLEPIHAARMRNSDSMRHIAAGTPPVGSAHWPLSRNPGTFPSTKELFRKLVLEWRDDLAKQRHSNRELQLKKQRKKKKKNRNKEHVHSYAIEAASFYHSLFDAHQQYGSGSPDTEAMEDDFLSSSTSEDDELFV